MPIYPYPAYARQGQQDPRIYQFPQVDVWGQMPKPQPIGYNSGGGGMQSWKPTQVPFGTGPHPNVNMNTTWMDDIAGAMDTVTNVAGSVLNPAMGIAGGILGAIGIGGMFGKRRAAHSADYYDYDPTNQALGRFKELTNLDSDWNRGMYGRFRTMAEDAGPSLDSLLGLSAAQNVSPSIAYARSRAQTAEARETAFRRFQDYTMGNEGYAQGYLGQHYGKEQWAHGMAAQDEWGQDEYDRSLYNQSAIGGFGGLMNWLG